MSMHCPERQLKRLKTQEKAIRAPPHQPPTPPPSYPTTSAIPRFAVHASVMEIHCERIRDLLCFSQSSDNLSVQQVGHGCIWMIQRDSMRFGGVGRWLWLVDLGRVNVCTLGVHHCAHGL